MPAIVEELLQWTLFSSSTRWFVLLPGELRHWAGVLREAGASRVLSSATPPPHLAALVKQVLRVEEEKPSSRGTAEQAPYIAGAGF
jgi:hypothetical protein